MHTPWLRGYKWKLHENGMNTHSEHNLQFRWEHEDSMWLRGCRSGSDLRVRMDPISNPNLNKTESEPQEKLDLDPILRKKTDPNLDLIC